MTAAKAKQTLNEIYTKHYGGAKGKAIKKDNVKITTAVKARKEAKKAIQPVEPSEDAAKQPVCATIADGVGIVEASPTVIKAPAKEGTRAALMAQAQAKGIKYFRILTKEELVKVLDSQTTQEHTENIITAAKLRWQRGWSAKAPRANNQRAVVQAPQPVEQEVAL